MNGNKGKSVLSQLREMKVGQKLTFPASRISYVRNVCTNFGLQWGQRYKTTTNREQKTIDVTREE